MNLKVQNFYKQIYSSDEIDVREKIVVDAERTVNFFSESRQ